jgi:hypothetical protein
MNITAFIVLYWTDNYTKIQLKNYKRMMSLKFLI